MKPFSLIIALVLVMLGYACVDVVDEGHVGMVSQFGRRLGQEQDPGLHFKWPLLQQVQMLDTRIRSADAAGLTQQTADGQTVDLDLVAKWRVRDARRFLAGGGSDQAVAALLRQWADEHLRSRVQTFPLSRLVALPAADLFGPSADALSQRLQQNLGVQMMSLELGQISMPEAGLPGLYRDMQAGQQRLATQLRAQGQAEADKIQADADSAARQRVADARVQASRIRGEGVAKALQLTAEAASQEPDFFAFYQNLQAYRMAFGQGGNVWILRPDSAFLKTMESGSAPATVIRNPSH